MGTGKTKTAVLIILFVFVAGEGVLFGSEKKLRFAGTGGIVLSNDLLQQSAAGGVGGAGLAIAYPVGSIQRTMNVELAIANWYNIYPYQQQFMQTLRFGFGIRVFLNVFEAVRPYFTHDICSHFVWVSDRAGYASTFGILLGLGIDVPLQKPPEESGRKRRESSSLFFDVSFNTFSLARFEEEESTRFLSASVGFSWLLPGGTGKDGSNGHEQ